MRELPSALLALGAYRQFIIYKIVPSESRPGKTDKLPLNYRTGHVSNAHDPEIWLDSASAIELAASWGEAFGVGFVFTEQDPFWFVDIDNCLIDGQWAPHAVQVAQLLAGCAIEISPSGTGVHLYGVGRPSAHSCKNEPLGLEFYHCGRFATITGYSTQGNAAADLSPVLPVLVNRYFPPDASRVIESVWTMEPVPEWSGIKDDSELIRRASLSRSTASAFGNRASFNDLWYANESVLHQCFPDPVRPYDCSSADAALAQHLAFWTGKDCERIRRLMEMSQLRRDKYEREDYLIRTILGAVSRQNDVFQAPALASTLPLATGDPQAAPSEPAAPSATQEPANDNRFLGMDLQIKLFAGCVYVTEPHKIMTPGGVLLKPDQFRVHYGGYSFNMDRDNIRTSRDPWEAFTQSQILKNPRVNGACFRPDLEAGAITHRNGYSYVNTYVPVDVARKAGDPTPFLAHLAKILPDANDQAILLAYMAAVVQHKGFKFQWAPLLQGVEGNGKTLFTRCVAEAVGRRYTHWPKASKLAKEFNAWMVGKIFYAVEDIYVPDARREVIEELKPMITGGDGLEIEAKGIDQTSADICGNFMFNSNHKDAIKKTGNDRRFCVLFSAQQRSEDLQRDGMAGDYFPNLYKWLRSDGYAIVTEYLHSYAIPAELDPSRDCQRAPISSTTGEAISVSTGSVEQEILEAVAQQLPGFAGGWISSLALEKLLDRLGLLRKISHNRRREMLESLGYKLHPSLRDGRVHNIVLPDSGKPRLYLQESSLWFQVTNPAEIAKAYEAANRITQALPFNTSFPSRA